MTIGPGLDPIIDSALIDLLTGWDRRLTDLEIPFAAVYRDFRRIEDKRFEAEGGDWKPLAESTVRDRVRKGYGGEHPILQRTRELRDSLTQAGAPDSVLRDEGDALFMGSSVPYAHWHQTGGATDGRPPARPEIDLTPEDSVRWALIMARYLSTGLPTGSGPATVNVPSPGAGPNGL